MEKEKLVKNGFDMIYLSACALNSVAPSLETVEKMDLTEVYKLSARHSMQAVTYAALESLVSKNPEFKEKILPELFNEWKLKKSKSVRNLILFDEERNKLTAFFEENKIWYMHLKGIVMQNYYPKLGMRQMHDNDILFDATRREDVYNYMQNSGYEVVCYNKGYPDAYKKAPSTLFEMHHSLYTDSTDEVVFNEYYKDVKHRLLKDEGNSFGYHFSDEDYYIHNLTHTYKHFRTGGNGIRFLMDVYVYLKNKENSLDFNYIEEQLEILGIKDFENNIRTLSNRIFSQSIAESADFGILSKNEREELLFYISAGTFGTINNYINFKVEQAKSGKKKGVFKYIIRRFFPDMNYYKVNYPWCYKYKIFIPFVAIYRIFIRSIVNFKELKYEAKALFKKEK